MAHLTPTADRQAGDESHEAAQVAGADDYGDDDECATCAHTVELRSQLLLLVDERKEEERRGLKAGILQLMLRK